MISRDRFELALERLKASDWERFEKLASSFLADEFPALRTLASASGDGGRDAELCSPTPTVVIQYSVRVDWKKKIAETISRIKETQPDTRVLIYVCPHQVGALADAVKADASARGMFLDIRDRSWFADRLHLSTANEAVAEELATAMVDPLLKSRGIVVSEGVKLSGGEAKAALFYLEMQWRDESSSKGLTRSCFEALIKAALRGTDSDHRISRADLYGRISEFLPHYTEGQLLPHVDSAIRRLTKRAIRHWQQADEFNLSHEEIQRIKDSASSIELLRSDFKTEIVETLESSAGVTVANSDDVAESIIDLIEKYFMKRGEEFAAAVANDAVDPINDVDLRSIVIANLPSKIAISGREPVEFVQGVISSLLSNPSDAVAEYANTLSDAYTLFAFLAEVPDVQSASKKLFGYGEIWLDTSVLLPIFAEKAFPETLRPFTAMLNQATKSGLKLFVTPGIIEEIERHLNRCVAYDRSENWEGRAPYVYMKYAFAGKLKGGFRDWVEQFVGTANPEQDIADYLSDEYGIVVEAVPLSKLEVLPRELVLEVTRFWEEVHAKRRKEGTEVTLMTRRLAQHDIENYLNALSERLTVESRSSLGYKTWWLTLDSAARELPSNVDRSLFRYFRHVPILSVNFLIRYMMFGPNRDRLSSANIVPRVFSDALFDNVPADLLTIAKEVREASRGVPERVVQRRIRDSLNLQKSNYGPADRGGMAGVVGAITEGL